MEKIIVIHNAPLLPRLKSALQIDVLRNRYNLEYWDLTELYGVKKGFSRNGTENYVKIFQQLGDIKKELTNIDKPQSIFIVQLDDMWDRRHLFSLLRKHNCNMVRINFYPKPSVFSLANIGFLFSKFGLKKFLEHYKSILYYYYKKLAGIQTYSRYFACSANTPRTDKINSIDYEKYMEIAKKDEEIFSEAFFVFIDVFFPLHPEMKVYVDDAKKVQENYLNSMRNFFDRLEKKHGKKVVIAAHPSSKYGEKSFGNRKIIHGKTGELVKASDGVITHYSTSYVYAVLFNKPLLFITTNQMKPVKNGLYKRMQRRASELGKLAYNIDMKPIDKLNFSPVENKIKEKYIYKHVTTKETENLTNAQILCSAFDEIFSEHKKKPANA